MKKKYIAECVQDFDFEWTLGALMVDGKEVAPAEKRVTHYTKGQVVSFTKQKQRDDFISAHAGKFRAV